MLKKLNCQLTDLNTTFLSVFEINHGVEATPFVTGINYEKP